VIELNHESAGWIRFKNLALDEVGREASPVFYAHSCSVFEVFFPSSCSPPPRPLLSSGHGDRQEVSNKKVSWRSGVVQEGVVTW